MASILVLSPAALGTWVLIRLIGQAGGGTPDISPLAYWGVAGFLLAFILWLYIDERKEHRVLRQKVLDEVFPALLKNNEQMGQSAEAMERLTIMAHDIAARPNLDPVAFNDWSRTLQEVKRVLETR